MNEFWPVALVAVSGISFVVGTYVGARIAYWLRGGE